VPWKPGVDVDEFQVPTNSTFAFAGSLFVFALSTTNAVPVLPPTFVTSPPG
jgi:hypothetical protein